MMANENETPSSQTAQDDEGCTLVPTSPDGGSSSKSSSSGSTEPFASQIITIHVGTPPTTFSVHKDVITEAAGSNYWLFVSSSGLEEPESGVHKLPNDDVETFGVFIKWAYGTASGFHEGEINFFERFSASVLLKLYALAEYFLIESLHNAIITAMHNIAKELPWWYWNITTEAFAYFERRACSDCHMDRLLVDWMVGDSLGGQAPIAKLRQHSELPERLVRAAFERITRLPSKKGFQMGAACCYYLDTPKYE